VSAPAGAPPLSGHHVILGAGDTGRVVPAGSPVAGIPIHAAGFAGCLVVARRPKGAATFDYNPPAGEILGPEDAIVLFGRRDSLARAHVAIASP